MHREIPFETCEEVNKDITIKGHSPILTSRARLRLLVKKGRLVCVHQRKSNIIVLVIVVLPGTVDVIECGST